jgi:Zn-dependent M28 family amino/carboxypeptidase
MIGRADEAHQDQPNFIYIIGSTMLSSDLHRANEEAAKKYVPDLVLDYRYNTKDDPNRFYYRSDHYNFAKHNIPSIFYFNGVHADYHQTTDDVDKINFEAYEKRTRLIFATAWEVANREQRLVVDQVGK